MMVYLLGWVVLVWILIYPAVDMYIRWLAPAIIRRGNVCGKQIHLSFDDGPDPQNTELLLDILRKMDVAATFFLVGEKAERHPDLVKQIIRDGHQIGLHTQHHHHAYLMGPEKSLDTIFKGKRVLEKLSGQPVVFFRPPWGALNLFEYWAVCSLGLKVVLWTANARDWQSSTGAEGILERLFKKIKPNTIIVLHDSGGEAGAPQNMLTALPDLINHFQSRGYQFVTLRELHNSSNK